MALRTLRSQRVLNDLYDHFLVQDARREPGPNVSWENHLRPNKSTASLCPTPSFSVRRAILPRKRSGEFIRQLTDHTAAGGRLENGGVNPPLQHAMAGPPI